MPRAMDTALNYVSCRLILWIAGALTIASALKTGLQAGHGVNWGWWLLLALLFAGFWLYTWFYCGREAVTGQHELANGKRTGASAVASATTAASLSGSAVREHDANGAVSAGVAQSSSGTKTPHWSRASKASGDGGRSTGGLGRSEGAPSGASLTGDQSSQSGTSAGPGSTELGASGKMSDTAGGSAAAGPARNLSDTGASSGASAKGQASASVSETSRRDDVQKDTGSIVAQKSAASTGEKEQSDPLGFVGSSKSASASDSAAATGAPTDASKVGEVSPKDSGDLASGAANDGDGKRPTVLSAARDGKADDLKQISGVGPKLEGLLHSLGFFHFDQIATWTEENVAWVDDHLGFKGRIMRDDWIGQAKKLASGETTEFAERVARGEVESSKKT